MGSSIKRKPHPHLRLVTEADRVFYEGPITRLGLWYRYPSVDYKKILIGFLLQCILIRAILYFGFHY